uniref:Disease resistance N-terminal domain-containing protein n=1 Tax=Oryza punctata TaxID=4537 RepID=A0A0E0LK73_ORYPU
MEGAMVSALNSLLFKLNDLLESRHKSLVGLRREIGFLESELRSMNSMLQRLADMEEMDAQAKECGSWPTTSKIASTSSCITSAPSLGELGSSTRWHGKSKGYSCYVGSACRYKS